jgi:hypothetical protein
MRRQTMKIKDVIDYNIMEEFLLAPMEWFEQVGKVTNTADGIFIHRDIGASILAVAHLDSVNDHNHFYVNRFGQDDIVFNTHLDDRLGAYVILNVLPRMGIHTDILLTEGEEVGRSTASHFETDKQYKWMFEFDRRGTDAVHYRYQKTEWTKVLRAGFGSCMYGSNSDINYLSHLKCCGVNVGTGYHDEHDIMAYANVSELISQIGKFMQFYQTHKRTWFEWVDKSYTTTPVTSGTTYHYELPAKTEEPARDEKYNPYEGMVIDLPLDIHEYLNQATGVIEAPTECAFCLKTLKPDNVHVFMGICEECERWAVQCSECEGFYCRTDDPSNIDPDDITAVDDLFYGTCSVCLDYQTRRFNGNYENNRLQNTNDLWDDDEYNAGDEGDTTGRHSGTG